MLKDIHLAVIEINYMCSKYNKPSGSVLMNTISDNIPSVSVFLVSHNNLPEIKFILLTERDKPFLYLQMNETIIN